MEDDILDGFGTMKKQRFMDEDRLGAESDLFDVTDDNESIERIEFRVKENSMYDFFISTTTFKHADRTP